MKRCSGGGTAGGTAPLRHAAAAARRACALLAALAGAGAAAAAGPAVRGDPASRLPSGDGASEYWDLVARFDSGHAFFARFMITNEGPGEKTGIAYGHLVDPDGAAHFFSNGRREARWQLAPDGRRLTIGSSDLDLTGPEIALRVDKKRLGVNVDLRFRLPGPGLWSPDELPGAPKVDLLAASAPIEGSAWFRGMEAPVALRGRAGFTHTWMDRSEPEIALWRLDFFSLAPENAVYLRELEAAGGGGRSRWLAVVRDGRAVFQSADWESSPEGAAPAQRDEGYPLPATLALKGRNLRGEITLKKGLLHHDPMEVMPQPFRFLLSLKMRPHRVWADSAFEVTYPSGSESVTIRGPGVATVTFLNPIPSKTMRTSPPLPGD